MLKILNLFSKKPSTTHPSTELRVVLDSLKLRKLLTYFPIGDNLKYFPAYREEITLDAIIIAYMINGEIIYSNNEVSYNENGELCLSGVSHHEVSSFAILIPSTIRNEAALDYQQKEILEKSGGFAKGNSITLIGQQKDGEIPIIDTVVTRNARLKEGYFDDTPVVVLNVDPALLELKDQRTQARLAAKIAGLVQTKLYSEPNHCTIVDFSGHTTKISCDSNELIPLSCKTGETITLTFNLPSNSEPSVMRGKVVKIEGSAMVVELTDILKGEAFEKLAQIDLVEIKTKLLQLQA